MKSINQMKLVIDSKSNNESFARVVVSAFIASMDPTIDEMADLKTAVSEAVTNSIVHGYKSTFGKIYITANIYDKGIVKVRIKDNGCGIPNLDEAMTPLFTTGESDRAGLGFTVMESFCDGLKVTSSVGKGTTVLLTKKINGKSQW